ncbi:MAG TPA: hypothetical protein VGA40_10705 [Candidatus Acidoferrales bacterium]
MNRAFFIVFVPAVLVGAAYLAVGWGLTVPAAAAVGASAAAVVGAAWMWWKKRES